MLNQSENKECPVCHKPMVKIIFDCSLTEMWKCTNVECNYKEAKEY